MARTISINSREYSPQIVQHSVDQLPGKPVALRATFTRESWPGTNEDTVITVTAQWRDGPGLTVDLPGGTVISKDGSVATTSVVVVPVPALRKRDYLAGDFTIQVHQTLRTALVVELLV